MPRDVTWGNVGGLSPSLVGTGVLPGAVVFDVGSVVVAAFAFGLVALEVHGLEWACV